MHKYVSTRDFDDFELIWLSSVHSGIPDGDVEGMKGQRTVDPLQFSACVLPETDNLVLLDQESPI